MMAEGNIGGCVIANSLLITWLLACENPSASRLRPPCHPACADDSGRRARFPSVRYSKDQSRPRAAGNVSSLVGLIGLFGIAVQNGLVLVAQTRALLKEGKPLREAIREASIRRVRPKLMTASTAICGLLPILVLRMHGAEIERPLAIVMTGGLATSTLFILLVLPTIYPRFARRKDS
jgi:hypothetical protein